MLPIEISPVHQLVAKWWGQRPPQCDLVTACRLALYTAVVNEISERAKEAKPCNYDPMLDHRIKWASEWIAVGEGSLARISPAVTACAAVHLDPPRARSGKELAFVEDDEVCPIPA